MKLITPEGRGVTTGRTRTMTEHLQALTPTGPDLVDGAFLLGLSILALFGFATTFDTFAFVFIGGLGVLLGMLAAHLASVLRWHWLTVIVLVIVEFFLVGGAVALHEELIAGFIPTLGAFSSLAQLILFGWKDMITTLPPLAGNGPFVALPYFMGLVAGALGFWTARRSRRLATAMVTPLALLAAVILLGTMRPAGVLLQGLGFAALGFGWLAVRSRRRRRITGSGKSGLTTVGTGAAMIVISLLGAAAIGGFFPGENTTRFVLRTYVQPPIELNDLSSPLVGFRKYSSERLKRFWDQSLLDVNGVPAGSLLRIAVLDNYSGHSWSATGGAGGGPDAGFQRIGTEIPHSGSGDPVTATITVLPAFEAAGELGPWVPSLGEARTVVFEGVNVKTHAGTFRYNLSTSQAVLADRDQLRDGDVVTVTSVPIPQGLEGGATPGAQSQLAPASYAFLSSATQKWAGTETDPLKRLTTLAAKLKAGYWSDGTLPGEGDYLPGHGQGRLSAFVMGQQLVGSDEQYAAAFALLCNQTGFPARVVFGAIVPESGEIKGQDVSAWVEVQTSVGWRAVPPSQFIPERTQRPAELPQQSAEDARATHVPPPNPSRLPGSFDQLSDSDLTGTRMDGGLLATLGGWVLAALRIVGPPILGLTLILGSIAGAKWLRRRRRRSRGVPSTRVAAGWAEVLDQARDLGLVIPTGATRLEQTRIIGSDLVAPLAVAANAATFGPDGPKEQDAVAFWTSVAVTRRDMLSSVNRRRRFLARFSTRSLLPERWAAVRLPSVTFRRPRWLTRSAPQDRLTAADLNPDSEG